MVKLVRENIGSSFVKAENNGNGQRFKQNQRIYRLLSEEEKEELIENGNQSDDWSKVRVSSNFKPKLIRNNRFYGLVRIGELTDGFLEYKEFEFKIGIQNSMIINCDIGDNVAISNLKYAANYIIKDLVIIQNLSELRTSEDAKFGVEYIKDGENEENLNWIEIINENGNRGILPFNEITSADAYLWGKYRGNPILQKRLSEFTQQKGTTSLGSFGVIESGSVIKNSLSIQNSYIGPHTYIKGVNKIKNVSILSNEESPVQIGEGCELVNGIMKPGSKSFYGVKAVRFILGENATLKYGARLINSFLGDNSTISCCEVLNALIFPNHEQHHNNSFLIAANIQGQSNLAAGATIGSNHNSRAADGEIIAKRGFWPGLSVTLKHNSVFASFNLIVKGNYPGEIVNPFPFALISNSTDQKELNINPSYWFRNNMYALARNSWKFNKRDKRINKDFTYEYDFLAPDTAFEIVKAINLLKEWEKQYPTIQNDLIIPKRVIENSNRPVRIKNYKLAIEEYTNQLILHVVQSVDELYENHNNEVVLLITGGYNFKPWINMGGILMEEEAIDDLINQIENNEINNWEETHEFYSKTLEKYPIKKVNHAISALLKVLELNCLTQETWGQWVSIAPTISMKNFNRIKESRHKDFTSPFRKSTFSNHEEMASVYGDLESNEFIIEYREKINKFKKSISRLINLNMELAPFACKKKITS